MKLFLYFDTKKLIREINTESEFYDIDEKSKRLGVIKKYKNKRGRSFSISLPKKIKISPSVVGLIVGEGFLGRRHFVFANSNEKAIEVVLEFLQQFDLPIHAYLEISCKNESEKFIKQCKKFWENYLDIKLKKVRLREEFNNITKHGTIHISLFNSLVAKLLNLIMEESKEAIEKNESYSIEYLRGIIAAEGNINIKNQTNCVYMIRISATKESEREHYKRCLEKVGVKIYCKDMPSVSKQEAKDRGWKTLKGRAGAVIISRWDNFLRVSELDLLDLHEDKKNKFAKYFVNNQFTKQFLSLSHFMENEFTARQVQTYLNLSGRKIDRLLTLWKKGYVDRIKQGKKYHYKLNDNYFRVYNHLKNLFGM